MYRISLIDMPFANLSLPSLGLTQLKAVLDERFAGDVSVEILYFNHDLAKYFGVDLYQQIAGSHEHHASGVGDWIFRQSAFPELKDNTAEYFRRYYPSGMPRIQSFKWTIQEKRRSLDSFLDSLLTKYKLGQSNLVGFTSMFAQNVPSFALARKIKEQNPEVIVVMGGANCESPMGQEIVKNVKQIDGVFSGSALNSFPQFVQTCLDGNTAARHRINGLFCRTNDALKANGGRNGPSLVVLDGPAQCNPVGDELDINTRVPLDYELFLNALECFQKDKIEPVLLLETSRGCWWGEKAHCTFCGLNGMTMKSRTMSPSRAIEEFSSVFKYTPRVKRFNCVDNILPKSYLREVLPFLNPPQDACLFYEVKADLTEDEMQILARARVKRIQPGIEALATSTLKLMKKGTTAFQNLIFLKNSLRYGIFPDWNLLIGFPGESEEVYKKYVQDLPLLVHLPPPSGAYPVRFDRYSPYFVKAQEYGLDLKPFDYYGMVYPFEPSSLTNLAYYFTDQNFGAEYFVNMVKWIGKINGKIGPWANRWRGKDPKGRPNLYFKQKSNPCVIYDSRGDKPAELEMTDVSRQVLECLEKPKKLPVLAAALNHIPDFDALREVAALQQRGLIFTENDHYLSLVFGTKPPDLTVLS